jgi:alpha-1,2-mannosyltransferase
MTAYWPYALSGCLLLGLFLGWERLVARLGRELPWPLVGAAALLLFGLLFRISEPQLEPLSDFYKAYYPAGQLLLGGPPSALRPILETRDYVNLPLVGYFFVPFGAFSRGTAGVLFLLVGACITVGAWHFVCEAARLDRSRRQLLLLLFALNGPFHYGFKEGNTSHVVLLLVVLAFLKRRGGRDLAAGALLGLAALVKLPLAMFGLYLLLRREKAALVGMSGVLAVAGLGSILVFGWELNVLWYTRCVAPFLGDVMSAYNVQSIHAALARAVRGPDALLDWDPRPLSAALRAIATTIVVLELAAVAWAARREPSEKTPGRRLVARELEFMLVLVLCLISGPMSWSHYYVWLLLPVAFVLAGGDHVPRERGTTFLAAVALVLAALPVVFIGTSQAWLMEAYARIVLAHFVTGGLLFFVLLVRARRALASNGATVEAP